MKDSKPRTHSRFGRIAVEMLLSFGVLLGWDYFGGSSDRFSGVQPHPFWIPVLLFTVQYGTGVGLVSAVLSSVLLHAGHLPEPQPGDDFFSFWWRVGCIPLQWFVAAITLGEIVARHREGKRKAEDEVRQLREREKILTDSFAALERLKQRREREIAGFCRSPAQIVDILAATSIDSPKGIFASICQLAAVCFSAEHCSIFEIERDGMTLCASHGWPPSVYSKRFPFTSPLFQAVALNGTPLSVLELAGSATLGDEGLMAVPILDSSTGRPVAMIKIEKLDPASLTLADLEVLRLLARYTATLLQLSRLAPAPHVESQSTRKAKQGRSPQGKSSKLEKNVPDIVPN